MSKDNQNSLKGSGLPRTPLGKKVSAAEKLIVLTSAESSAEEDNGSDQRPLLMRDEGQKPTTSVAAEREADDKVLAVKKDQIFKKPLSINFPRRGDLLQPRMMGLSHPNPKMNIPVLEQHQWRPMNKPLQLFNTYHQLYWDNLPFPTEWNGTNHQQLETFSLKIHLWSAILGKRL
uniref:Uncharacterized protein n=1 Tax=Romanomermis culicivorax TaxID=13658 RepID=A0A915HMP4_ROMCU